ncbi:MAG: type IV toxin-antitoxin system AbiEi family antitoxin domain-containing protein [Eubacterium sp.]|nr:type IV toxin-antitoxin system AbiEi family antitoxin domain-containing protein [Eubacterium sp.]
MLKRTYDKIYAMFEKSSGYMRTRTLLKNKVSTIHIRELYESGEIERISHGNYWGTFLGKKKPDDYKFVEACMTNDRAVICGPSACFYHGLLKHEPDRVYIATMRTDRAGMELKFPVSRHYYSARAFDKDVKTYTSAGIKVRVYDVDRTVVDCIRMADKIGDDMLKSILREYKRYSKKNLDRLYEYADEMRVGRLVREYVPVK